MWSQVARSAVHVRDAEANLYDIFLQVSVAHRCEIPERHVLPLLVHMLSCQRGHGDTVARQAGSAVRLSRCIHPTDTSSVTRSPRHPGWAASSRRPLEAQWTPAAATFDAVAHPFREVGPTVPYCCEWWWHGGCGARQLERAWGVADRDLCSARSAGWCRSRTSCACRYFWPCLNVRCGCTGAKHRDW